MLLCELYHSVQGEGHLTGVESVFIRTAGCNLRCWFCDTPYSSWNPDGFSLTVDEIVERCLQYECQHVVITGGEPMLPRQIVDLTTSLKRVGRHITIETAGTVDRPVQCDLMSISPKLANSTPAAGQAGRWAERHERTRQRPDVIRRLIARYDYQLKFVVDQPPDCDEVLAYLQAFPSIRPDRVLLMPQGTTVEQLEQRRPWIETYCGQHGLGFCPRMQIQWFGHVRGT